MAIAGCNAGAATKVRKPIVAGSKAGQADLLLSRQIQILILATVQGSKGAQV